MNYKDTQINHKILIEGQKERLNLKTLRFLLNSLDDIISKLKDNESSQKNLQALNSATSKVFKDIHKNFSGDLKELAEYEIRFQKSLLEQLPFLKKANNISGLSKSLIKELVEERAFQGRIIEEFLSNQKIRLNAKIIETFNFGIAQGLSTDKIIKNVKLAASNISAQDVKTLSRTAVTNVLNSAKDELYKENNIERYQYVAILDNLTTPICQKLDAKVYNVSDKSAPRPPQHYNCRSSTIPIFSDDDIIKENYKDWAEKQNNTNNLIDEKTNSFKLNKNTITSIKELEKKERIIVKDLDT